MEAINTSTQKHLNSPKLTSSSYFLSFFLEPGYYEDGAFGIRLENVVLVVPAKPKVSLYTENQIRGDFKNIEKTQSAGQTLILKHLIIPQ